MDPDHGAPARPGVPLTTLDEADRALAEWRSRLARIDENLIALQLDPVNTRLEQSRDGGLEGVTRERMLPALDAMQELFARRGMLYDVVERATAARARLNPRRPRAALAEIERLLWGPSIVLPPVEAPLARRRLLGGSETTMTPEQLLGAMVSSYEQARDAVAAVDRAWRRLEPECRQAAAEAARLQDLAAGLSEEAAAELTAIEARLASVEVIVARDPLGTSGLLTGEVLEALARVEPRLGELRLRRERVARDLERARALLTQLRALPGPVTAAPGRVEGLADWLTTLVRTVDAGRWPAAEVGVDRWLEAAGELLAADRASAEPMERREDLLGRLRARRQQARVLADRAGRPLDAALEEVAARAERLLRQVPTPLAEAASLVAEYEAGLRGS